MIKQDIKKIVRFITKQTIIQIFGELSVACVANLIRFIFYMISYNGYAVDPFLQTFSYIYLVPDRYNIIFTVTFYNMVGISLCVFKLSGVYLTLQ